jgi:lipid-A-disaccharide synthase
MRYFIVAGEASGDLHGAELIRQLSFEDTDAEIACWGGELMSDAGADLRIHYRDLAFMGFTEVVMNLHRIIRYYILIKRQIAAFRPDLVILIDYPGFNLRLADYLKKRGIRVYYYISPKVWAWKRRRVYKIRKLIDRMYVIFPFEEQFFAGYNYRVHYFGNPLADIVLSGMADAPDPEAFKEFNGLDGRPVIALLAGSRVQEVRKMLPRMISIRETYPDYQFVVAGVRSVPAGLYSEILSGSDVKVVYEQMYALLNSSELALVTSGTATLETALAGVPQVVCYYTSPLTYMLARLVLRIKFISLVNIIMEREVVKELIQGELNQYNLVKEAGLLLRGGWKREVMQSDYRKLRDMLSGKGAAAAVARNMVDSLKLVSDVN